MTEIKVCPCCGGAARLHTDSTFEPFGSVQCLSCGLSSKWGDPGETIVTWNLRLRAKPTSMTKKEKERLNAAEMTVTEGSEIHAELCVAIAGFAGELLRPCDPTTCPGHFGPKAQRLLKQGEARYKELWQEEQARRQARAPAPDP